MIVPDLIEPVIGYRAWRVLSDGTLAALHKKVQWPAMVPMEALCPGHTTAEAFAVFAAKAPEGLAAGHAYRAGLRPPVWSIPVEDCSCGIYAHKDQLGMHIATAKQEKDRVWGSVALWGKVIAHRDGYRAQFAYPKALSTNSQYGPLVATKYGVSCVYEDVPVESVVADTVLASYPILSLGSTNAHVVYGSSSCSTRGW